MKASHQPAPKCGHCQGWGFEPDQPADVHCTVCKGTGRPPAAPPQPQTAELLDG